MFDKIWTRLKHGKIQSADSPDDVCIICYENWTNAGTHGLSSLPCGHLFGYNCIAKWLTDHDTCPECNARSLKTDIRQIRARNLRAVDNSNEEILKREIEELKVEMAKTKVENQKLKSQNQILSILGIFNILQETFSNWCCLLSNPLVHISRPIRGQSLKHQLKNKTFSTCINTKFLACFCVLTSVYLLFVISSVKFISSHPSSTDEYSESSGQSAMDIALNEPLDALIFIFQLIFKLGVTGFVLICSILILFILFHGLPDGYLIFKQFVYKVLLHIVSDKNA